MSDLSYSASNAVDQAAAYVAALLSALGSRDPLQVLEETPSALRLAVRGLTREQDGTLERAGKWSLRHVAQHLVETNPGRSRS
jgi:hypothetical protein